MAGCREGVSNFRVSQNTGNFWLAEELLASQQGLQLRGGVSFGISVGKIEVFVRNSQLIQTARYVFDSCWLMNGKVESILLSTALNVKYS